ncbi:hypothetical protein BDBG_17954 [Blastomyces gilchristii SLH14081]|uniref:Uncharacterized protein n=1 Tax=Blastomyces gilchristii (strain SLH14081) TaxID=559298 RepID=A0A179V3S7_BLAGS|nr:uncharacterized protein BDBG_17954 [Blastomyces gilchristii SLH14081]OAT14001.1 hypothetical protein BDBG_17954 [Blastomyces gilchristii SLH14081]
MLSSSNGGKIVEEQSSICAVESKRAHQLGSCQSCKLPQVGFVAPIGPSIFFKALTEKSRSKCG